MASTALATMSIDSITGPKKAAIMLVQLGKERSARVLSKLDDDEVEALMTQVVQLGDIPPTLADDVVKEFYATFTGSGGAGNGGMGFAKALLESSFGRERAGDLLDRVAQASVGQPFDFLNEADGRQILSFINGEHPQTIALVLSHLRAQQASAAMVGLSAEMQGEVAQRIARMERTPPDVIAVVAETIQRKASSVLAPQSSVSVVGGVQPLVDIINRADPGTGKRLLEDLAKRDPALAEQVRAQMFTFDDILTLDDRAMQQVLREVEAATLAVALKGVRDEVRDKILKNVSERARENLLEEIELLGQVRLSAAEEGRAAVVTVVRQLEESGQITIQRESDDEYVA